MKLTNPKLKSLLLAMAMPILSFAGKTDTTKLSDISQKMYDEGNRNYLLADAVKDGFIKEGKSYSYSYEKGEIKINAETLPEPYKTQYEQKMDAFLKKERREGQIFSMRGSKMRVDELGSNTFKDHTLSEPEKETVLAEREEYQKGMENLLGEMVKDGLVKDANNTKIKWNYRGVFADGKKLKADAEKKYIAMLEGLKVKRPKKMSDGFSYTVSNTVKVGG